MRFSELDALMKKAKKIHLIGIGGISMSSLAMITKEKGYAVSGSDRNESPLTKKLEAAGITVTYAHAAENVRGADLVVYTAAVHEDNPEMAEAGRLGLPLYTRAEYLGWLMSGYRERIGVAGTHGKSTVTSMLAEIYLAGSLDPTVVSGAELSSMEGAYRVGGEEYFLFEACEYCDSFLSFCPTTAVVTNLEYDHADYFKDMEQLRESFRRYIGFGDTAVLNADDPETAALMSDYHGKIVTFGVKNDANYTAKAIEYRLGNAKFALFAGENPLCEVTLSVPGYHNVLNALAAAATALSCGATPEAVQRGLAVFGGAKRRFEYMGKTEKGALVYNDYAHHPSELRATLSAAKAMGRRLVAVFQPHTYSRTASLFDDFAAAFGDADEVIFADIYAAREENIYGVSSALLAEKTPGAVCLGDCETIARHLLATAGTGDLILILGAGDILRLGGLLIGQ